MSATFRFRVAICLTLALAAGAARMKQHLLTDVAARVAEVRQDVAEAQEVLSEVHVETNSSEMDYETALRTNATSFTWMNLTAEPCEPTKGYTFQWYGSAPFCRGEAEDCTGRGGVVESTCSGCHGKTCWTGKKVMCKFKVTSKVPDDCDAECNSKFTVSIFGTAPFCGGNDCDCLRHGMIPWRVVDAYNCPCQDIARCIGRQEGTKCWTGQKVVCVKPKMVPIEMQKEMSQMKSEDCTQRDKLDQEKKMAIINGVTDILKQGVEVAAKVVAVGR